VRRGSGAKGDYTQPDWRRASFIPRRNADRQRREKALMPFAGRRESGYGVGGIPWTMQEMTEQKMIVFAM
jgi:hypothetical protein